MLSHAGYAAKAIYSAAEGVEAAKWFRPEMLICALSTGMQNIEVATSIRRVVPGCKVLLFSPRPIEKYADQRVDEIGRDCELIDEPLHPRELLSKIKARIG
jgi:DNA-binding response OmpR family regulator